MKKSIGSFFLAFVFLTVLLIGCAPAPTPVPPTFTPSPKPTSTATATPLPSVTPTSIPTDTPTTTPDLKPPFGSQYTTVEFIGKKFELRFNATDQPVQIYEYYLPNESPSDWIELVEIQIYPVNPDGNKPLDFANRTADAFIKQYPDMRYSLLTKDNADEAILDFFYPTATREGYLEFDAFKFFRDSSSSHVIGFHYAKNIEGISSSRSSDDVLGDIKKTIEEIESAMAEFNLFSK
jgi:hypothetical protein